MHSDVEHLAPRLSRGDEHAYRELIGALGEPLYRYAFSILRDPDAAEDAVQTCLIRLYKSRKRLREGSLKAYAYRITRNVARTRMRDSSLRSKREQESSMDGTHDSPELAAMAREAWNLAQQLPDDMRDAVVLHVGHGLTLNEAAEVLDIPRGTVSTRVRKGLEELRGKLATAPMMLPALSEIQDAMAATQATPVSPPSALLTRLETQLMATVTAKITSTGVILVAVCLLLSLLGTWLLLQPGEFGSAGDGNSTPVSLLAKGDPEHIDTSGNNQRSTSTQPTNANTVEHSSTEAVKDRDAATDRSIGTRADDEQSAIRRVHGAVFDAKAGLPIAGAAIKIVEDGTGVKKWLGRTGSDGSFDFEVPSEQVAGTARLVISQDDYVRREVSADDCFIDVRLYKVSTVVVTVKGGSGCPRKGWLKCEDKGTEYPYEFEPNTRTATAVIDDIDTGKRYRAGANWFGRTVASEPFELQKATEHRVDVEIPIGATIRVSLIGPDGRPMGDALVDCNRLVAKTDENGFAEFVGVPSPTTAHVYPWKSADEGAFAVGPKTVDIETESDFVDVQFDLTGTGIVDCSFSSGNARIASRLKVVPEGIDAEPTLIRMHGRFGHEHVGELHRFYGLPAGRYEVTANCGWPNGDARMGVFEVELPPIINVWEQAHTLSSVRVRLNLLGVEEDTRATRFYDLYLIEPNGHITAKTFVYGEMFVSTTREDLAIYLFGGGFASSVIPISKARQGVLDVQMEASGEVVCDLNRTVLVEFLSTKSPAMRSGALPYGIQLPPGRYRILDARSPKKFTPVEFDITAGEKTTIDIEID